jgi:hypothetical protein
MIVRCFKCGQLYERFNTGGYQHEEPHNCKKGVNENGRRKNETKNNRNP